MSLSHEEEKRMSIKDMRKAFADIGTDELIFWPCLADLDQIDRLEDVLG